jgi:hypothetical protein
VFRDSMCGDKMVKISFSVECRVLHKTRLPYITIIVFRMLRIKINCIPEKQRGQSKKMESQEILSPASVIVNRNLWVFKSTVINRDN